MELTIEQALQQGLALHKEGKLQEAERLYQAILQAQPLNPGANHNLGVIAVSVNKVELALPLFKTALEANPKVEQFWLSYIDALIKENQLETAKSVIEQGRKVGLVGDKIDALESELQLKGQPVLPKSSEKKKSLTLKDKRKQVAESKQQKKQAKLKSASSVSPSQSQIDILLEHYQSGRYGEAEKLALTVTQQFPGHQFSWKLLGAIFKQVGKLTESLNAKKIAVQLDPQDYEAHYNLGNAFEELSRLEEAEASFRRSILLKPDYAEAHLNLGNTVKNLGKLEEAEVSYRQAIILKPDLAKAHFNLGITLKELDKLNEAEVSYRQAIAVKPDYAEAHQNLAAALKDLDRLEEAEVSYRQAIKLKPDVALAHFNLGVLLYGDEGFEDEGGHNYLGRLNEAEASYRQAIILKSGFAKAHLNLANTLRKLGRLDEAEISVRQAITDKPDYAEAHNSLGIVLNELGRLDEAEASYRQAITLKPNYSLAYFNLGKVLYIIGCKDLALESLEQASRIDPQTKEFRTLSAVIKAKKSREESEVVVGDTKNIDSSIGLISSPLILNRVIEAELVSTLYEMNFRELNKTRNDDARYGSGICSPDFSLFEDNRTIIKNLAADLTKIMMEAVESEIYIHDSFFNILRAGGGLTPHTHLGSMDKEMGMANQKYSLVYYLAVGDQSCREPGILKFDEPLEEILPCDGMIIIFPAGRIHSAVYSGKIDRVMVGVNFYSL